MAGVKCELGAAAIGEGAVGYLHKEQHVSGAAGAAGVGTMLLRRQRGHEVVVRNPGTPTPIMPFVVPPGIGHELRQ
jgi:hypothetical protein